jgi:ABC-type sugar transport system substrate-binding protein
VLTYDSDANADARSFFVNQATAEGIGQALMDTAAQLCGEEGEFAIITATLTAANMNEWRKHIQARLAEKYPKMKLVDTSRATIRRTRRSRRRPIFSARIPI